MENEYNPLHTIKRHQPALLPYVEMAHIVLVEAAEGPAHIMEESPDGYRKVRHSPHFFSFLNLGFQSIAFWDRHLSKSKFSKG